MDIKISTKERNDEPKTLIFHGNYALESMFEKLLEKYYGLETKNAVMKVLNTKITEKEINEFLNKKVHDKDFENFLQKRL